MNTLSTLDISRLNNSRTLSVTVMNPRPMTQAALDYQRIEKAISYLQAHFLEQPDLAAVARAVHLSEYHFQRLFSRWAGISPKRFVQFLTLEHAKQRLLDSQPVLEASLDSGLSGPGRLHDLFVKVEAITPGEFKTGGAGVRIDYGFHQTPFGECLLALTSRGICWLGFLGPLDRGAALEELRTCWHGAEINRNPAATSSIVGQVFSRLSQRAAVPLSLLLMGTNFQIKVWQALLRIPEGRVASYEEIGQAIGVAKAARAVGAAVGQNPIAYLIPCHRVIRKTGLIGGYRWGSARKHALLGWEAARNEVAS